MTKPIKYGEGVITRYEADYELCIVLLTRLFREDQFSNSSFERCSKNGMFQFTIDRIIALLG